MIVTTLPTNSDERKDVPVMTGCIDYFPAALAGVAKHSKKGNDKHNPGQLMHHARGKSSDHADCIVRHLMDLSAMVREVEQSDFEFVKLCELLYEANALCWRSLALSQELHERFTAVPLAPRARVPKPLAFSVDSVLNAPPPADADGLAKALGRFAAQAPKDGPSLRDGSLMPWSPADQGACEAAPIPRAWPSEKPSKR